MQLQSISSQYPNVFSITQIREDIDVLDKALNEFGRARILRGQKVFFDAVDPDYEGKKRAKIKNAVAGIRKFAQNQNRKSSEISATEWLIRERDRMRTPEYYA